MPKRDVLKGSFMGEVASLPLTLEFAQGGLRDSICPLTSWIYQTKRSMERFKGPYFPGLTIQTMETEGPIALGKRFEPLPGLLLEFSLGVRSATLAPLSKSSEQQLAEPPQTLSPAGHERLAFSDHD